MVLAISVGKELVTDYQQQATHAQKLGKIIFRTKLELPVICIHMFVIHYSFLSLDLQFRLPNLL